MSTDWLTVLKSRNTRLDLMMSGRLLVLSSASPSALMMRGEQNLLTTLSPLGWLGSWILSLTEELQSGPLNYKLSERDQISLTNCLSSLIIAGGSKQVMW